METDGDNCSLCRRPFHHRDRTIGGLTGDDGTVVLVGPCCASQVNVIYTEGVYIAASSSVVSLLLSGVWGTA